MSTGIVSIGLSIDDAEALSRALLVVSVLVWFALGAVLAALALRRRPLLLAGSRTPAALTAVAGTSVVGARLSMLGWNREAAALLAVGALLWLLLVPYVLAHWRWRTVGVSFVLTVATESLAVLAARLAVEDGERWLELVAMAYLGLGLVFYVLVLSGFDLREVGAGRGDHWVAGGALAIATLACARCAQAAGVVPGLRAAAGSLDTATLALWIAALAWLPALVAAELVRRRGGHDIRRWATVFPLGMYAVCSFATGDLRGLAALDEFARVWIWVAFAAWLAVSAATVRALVRRFERESW